MLAKLARVSIAASITPSVVASIDAMFLRPLSSSMICEPPTVRPPSKVAENAASVLEPEIVVAPAIAPALLMPWLFALIELTESCPSSSNPLLPAPPIVKVSPDKPPEPETVLTTVSPSASTVKPVIVIVPIVRSPEPSRVVTPETAPPALTPTATTAPLTSTVKSSLTLIPPSREARPLNVPATPTTLPSVSTVKSSFVLIPPSRLARLLAAIVVTPLSAPPIATEVTLETARADEITEVLAILRP